MRILFAVLAGAVGTAAALFACVGDEPSPATTPAGVDAGTSSSSGGSSGTSSSSSSSSSSGNPGSDAGDAGAPCTHSFCADFDDVAAATDGWTENFQTDGGTTLIDHLVFKSSPSSYASTLPAESSLGGKAVLRKVLTLTTERHFRVELQIYQTLKSLPTSGRFGIVILRYNGGTPIVLQLQTNGFVFTYETAAGSKSVLLDGEAFPYPFAANEWTKLVIEADYTPGGVVKSSIVTSGGTTKVLVDSTFDLPTIPAPQTLAVEVGINELVAPMPMTKMNFDDILVDVTND